MVEVAGLNSVPTAEQSPEELRETMADTRASLTDKLESLEAKMMGKAEAAQASVEQTIDSVKESVKETVQTVKRTFDLEFQVSQRPWFMVGASALAGFVLGSLVPGSRRDRSSANGIRQSVAPRTNHVVSEKSIGPGTPSLKDKLLSRFDEEITMLESVAIGSAMGMLRDWLKKAAPSLATQVDKVMNSATNKMGGEPIEGPVLRESPRIGADFKTYANGV
jgi:ElaB/YqjD/DUF883 family membrane-anchored ribosome-binding protein